MAEAAARFIAVIVAQFGQDRSVVGWIRGNADVGVVFCRRSQQSRPTNIDRLDSGLGAKRIEIADYEVDHFDVVGFEINLMLGVLSIREDAPVNTGVKRRHTVSQHDR